MVGAAQRKADAKYGMRFDSASTVLIGDTPRDVEAGRLGGAYVVAVATGEYPADRLADVGANVVLPDLCDTDLVVRAVLAVRAGRPAS
jgi:phosphoglycolate phosphatase-like HAD superfamily hydrolase